ncbi:hypothetical protein [Haloarcula amylolytica]|uniref:hypothetical protein n=1 Tax=Haloarcula amylolytica TaxID=396317 RepID=UPI003C7113A7
MKRRELLLVLGTMTGSSGALMGSGAFSSTAAGRSVTVSVAGDMEAYLGIDELGSGGRSTIDNNTLELYFPSLSETSSRTGGDPDLGLGTDSVYYFDKDAEEGINGVNGLIQLTNRSANPIKIYTKEDPDNSVNIELYDVSDVNRTPLSDDPPELAVGSNIRLGVKIDTSGVEPDSLNETLTIIANSV